MASGTIVFIPSNGANLIQTAQGFPSAVQSSGAIPYLPYGGQQVGISYTAPQQVPQRGALEKFLNVEARVLGAVQIMIGLIHIGFGAVSLCLAPSGYFTLSAAGGYPFWGGIFVKCSVGMNITSAIASLIGILLCISELTANGIFSQYDHPYWTDWAKNVGIGLSSMLLLFSLLEFCITVSLTHFGCQANCCADDQPTVVFVPYHINGDAAVAVEPDPPPPPSYDNVVTKPQ
ncbi:membrane-spanning 4-domains subfamily A member 8-like [Python bivittatus]|uniref:Membrane-spanning 4-domains subfamily A member 8-like n=1 Tax=Python bivittatus TaxID=176946 RepID=A0A9F5MVZ4_PYTBI|nr:membrane-spanning 4-domains subfamily A member 8-like [Python bivittatus]XP_025028399.1 membrane-spanning 4-domains subfamily A member 8-like [Python bivittatus]XP_025028401.1 membrane-spanning 4-domains subfamily A member 8-like [Python bivittatus]XP_025028402.1 membrane-spanning 4-domains subfamily A member 8-like [Python bivittatus]XP_025028403.1 membrane-spanning 4-domains subfamily A member 8-like [Python bivittatus]